MKDFNLSTVHIVIEPLEHYEFRFDMKHTNNESVVLIVHILKTFLETQYYDVVVDIIDIPKCMYKEYHIICKNKKSSGNYEIFD